MKKRYIPFLFIIMLGFLVGWSTSTKAAEVNSLKSGYYTIYPKNNSSLQVGTRDFSLINPDPDLQKFEFFYLPDQQAYLINDQFAEENAFWNGDYDFSENLQWAEFIPIGKTPDPNRLWTTESLGNGKYIIHNKKDSSLVWSLTNYYATLNTRVNLEKIHTSSDPLRDGQIFILTMNK